MTKTEISEYAEKRAGIASDRCIATDEGLKKAKCLKWAGAWGKLSTSGRKKK